MSAFKIWKSKKASTTFLFVRYPNCFHVIDLEGNNYGAWRDDHIELFKQKINSEGTEAHILGVAKLNVMLI